jgi:pteridine reductase
VITGGARRIGRSLAISLHQQGYRLVLHYQHSRTEAMALATLLNRVRPDSCKTLCGNLADLENICRWAQQAVESFGEVQVLINNASAFLHRPWGQIQPDDLHSIFGSNTTGPLLLTQALGPMLKAACGCVINITDSMTHYPEPDLLAYKMAKSALETMTRGLACTLAPEVRVNGIAPGAILMPENIGDPQAHKARLCRGIPLQRAGSPQDIAQAMHYLIEARYVTGHVLYVDGGRSVGSASIS